MWDLWTQNARKNDVQIANINYLKFYCYPQINTSYIIKIQPYDYENHQKYLVVYKNVNLWLCCNQSTSTFSNHLSVDILNFEQWFTIAHITHLSSSFTQLTSYQPIQFSLSSPDFQLLPSLRGKKNRGKRENSPGMWY